MSDKTQTVSMTAENAMFLASAPKGSGDLIDEVVAKTGASFSTVLAWIWAHKSQFLQIALEAAQGNYVKAVADFIAALTGNQPAPTPPAI